MALTEVNSLGIKDGEVKTADIAADAVTGAKIADDAIDSEHYTDGSIDTAHIADDAVTADKLANAINTDIAAKAVLTGSTDNTVCTVTGANAITGESNVHINGGIVIAGHTASTTTSQGEGPFFQAKSTDSRAGLSCIRHSADASGGGVYLGKSRNATIGSNTVVQDNDELGRITWSGDDGTDVHSIAARIDAHIDGTPGSNDMPGRLGFWTTADGAHNPTERMRIAQNGNVGIGTGSVLTDPDNLLHMESSSDFAIHLLKTGVASGMIRNKGNIDIAAASGGATGQLISFSNGANTGSLTERGRIDGSGYLLWACTSQDGNASTGIRLANTGSIFATRDAEYGLILRRSSSDGGTVLFRRDSTDVGNISVTTSATSYNSGSDYRLKQDDEPISDGITRLKQLKPIKFKWKNDTSKFVDGFFAHEVSPVVPESITGEKDAVYAEDDETGHKKGDPIYQQIDQSKLVPLLTAALQEAITEIETLKTKVAALESA